MLSSPVADALSWGLCAAGVIVAGATVLVLRPGVVGQRVKPMASMVGMGTVFAIPQILVVAGILLGLAGRAGLLARRPALVGGALLAAASLLLLVYFVQMARGRPLVDGTRLADADHPFAAALTDEQRALLRAPVTEWPSLFTHRTRAFRGVRVTRGVVYRVQPDTGRRMRLDVYHPPTALGPGPFPSVMYIHGGGWIAGTRGQSPFLMRALAQAGWTVFAISYRFAPRHPLPAAVVDCKAAIAFLRARAGDFGARSDRVVVMGGSAGGHLAGLCALAPNVPLFQPGFEDVDTHVDGAVLMYAPSDFEAPFTSRPQRGLAELLEVAVVRQRFRDAPDLYRALSPAAYAATATRPPPILLLHGTRDGVVPIEESRALAERLRARGCHVNLVEVPWGQHAFEVPPSPLLARTLRIITRFLAHLPDPGI